MQLQLVQLELVHPWPCRLEMRKRTSLESAHSNMVRRGRSDLRARKAMRRSPPSEAAIFNNHKRHIARSSSFCHNESRREVKQVVRCPPSSSCCSHCCIILRADRRSCCPSAGRSIGHRIMTSGNRVGPAGSSTLRNWIPLIKLIN